MKLYYDRDDFTLADLHNACDTVLEDGYTLDEIILTSQGLERLHSLINFDFITGFTHSTPPAKLKFRGIPIKVEE